MLHEVGYLGEVSLSRSTSKNLSGYLTFFYYFFNFVIFAIFHAFVRKISIFTQASFYFSPQLSTRIRCFQVAFQANHLPRLPTSEGEGQSKESVQKSMVKGLSLCAIHTLYHETCHLCRGCVGSTACFRKWQTGNDTKKTNATRKNIHANQMWKTKNNQARTNCKKKNRGKHQKHPWDETCK